MPWLCVLWKTPVYGNCRFSLSFLDKKLLGLSFLNKAVTIVKVMFQVNPSIEVATDMWGSSYIVILHAPYLLSFVTVSLMKWSSLTWLVQHSRQYYCHLLHHLGNDFLNKNNIFGQIINEKNYFLCQICQLLIIKF